MNEFLTFKLVVHSTTSSSNVLTLLSLNLMAGTLPIGSERREWQNFSEFYAVSLIARESNPQLLSQSRSLAVKTQLQSRKHRGLNVD